MLESSEAAGEVAVIVERECGEGVMEAKWRPHGNFDVSQRPKYILFYFYSDLFA